MKPLTRDQITWRAAQDVEDGMAVNLGIGLPEGVANHIRTGHEVILHSENGILGMGRLARPDEIVPNLINAGKVPITMARGASIFDQAQSFALVRGGHIDLCLLGAFQVAGNGDLANWSRAHDDRLPAIGGAMDLARGARSVWVLMAHTQSDGTPRILERCSYPLTCAGVVRRIYTDLAVIDLTSKGAIVSDMLPDLSREELQSRTGLPLTFAANVAPLCIPC
ncbi:3-oxoacid CoA-transferase subunit B [Ottowia thiooxydans]|uniref:3-oxoadipate CoA-transferase beta subunit n=1 Tax=Ottowia thiooxydans TaxID=219182 RepID=A0ABV2QF99_9BURK